MHDLVRLRALFLFLAVRCRCHRRDANQRYANASQSNLSHVSSSVGINWPTNPAKDTPPFTCGQDSSISRPPIDTCLFLNSLNSLQTSSEMLALQPRNQVTWFRDGYPPHPPVPTWSGPGPRRQRKTVRHRLNVASRNEANSPSPGEQEESMRIVLSFLLAAALACAVAPTCYAEPLQVMQGTQVHLTLLSGISTAVAREGDPFVAVVAEPVYLGSQLVLPAGTRVNGIIGTVEAPRHFSALVALAPKGGKVAGPLDRADDAVDAGACGRHQLTAETDGLGHNGNERVPLSCDGSADAAQEREMNLRALHNLKRFGIARGCDGARERSRQKKRQNDSH